MRAGRDAPADEMRLDLYSLTAGLRQDRRTREAQRELLRTGFKRVPSGQSTTFRCHEAPF